MPPRLPARRALRALVIAASTFLIAAPTAVLAGDPPIPLPGYVPTFVTERQPGPWVDCTWASASMLLDKWTNGAKKVDRDRLRALSGDLEGGSNLGHVRIAFAKLGISLKWSPGGGDSVTWNELLDRLNHGGGAILLGDYSRLPRKYGQRWDPQLWTNTGVLDDHAIYLDGYDRKTKRILVFDPLATPGWGGEWIPAAALKKFAWRGPGGAIWTALTPAAQPAPFDGVELGDPTTTVDATSLRVSWPITRTPKAWAFAGATVTAEVTAVDAGEPLDDIVTVPLTDALTNVPSPANPPPPIDPSEPLPAPSEPPPLVVPPTTPFSAVADGILTATIPLPAPGIYEVNVTLTDNRLGREVVTAGPFTWYVPGPRSATYAVQGGLQAEPGAFVNVPLTVRNAGIESWADLPFVPGLRPDTQRLEAQLPRNTRLVGTWVAEDWATDEDRGAEPYPAPIDFGPVALEPGDSTTIDAVVQVPAVPGFWHLVVDVVDDQIGSFGRAGSAPGDVDLEVLTPGEHVHNL